MISNQAVFIIKIKEPSLLRTKLTMSPLTRKQVFDGKPKFEQSIPPQVIDIAKAKTVAKTSKASAKVAGTFYVILFCVLTLAGGYLM